MSIFRHFIGALLVVPALVTVSPPAEAASRDCTAEEKANADQALLAIAKNQNFISEVTEYHLPYGIHQSSISDTSGERPLFQAGYVMLYDADLMTSLWSSYRLTSIDIDEAEGQQRVNCFRKDPRLEVSPTHSDYDEPVFDRGHIVPDADLKDNLLHQINSYVYTNMAPQHCRFNRGIWLSMEYLERDWAEEFKDILITSGAIFDQDGAGGRDNDRDAVRMISRNGKSRVAVPSGYFKTFVRNDNGTLRSITFSLPHNNSSNKSNGWGGTKNVLIRSIVSLEEIEATAGMRLHPQLSRADLTQATSSNIEGWGSLLEKHRIGTEGRC